uniref:Uncharacterized protein n=1 Tax=Stomoxys calcitrans TaxID=35570 RepID=A0A1I8QCN4_STOCA
MKKSKSSINSRMDYAREHNQFAAFSKVNVESIHKAPRNNEAVPEDICPEIEATSSNQTEFFNCICNRKAQIIECQKCKMLCYGRVSHPCAIHPNVTYLLDLFYCPACICSREYLRAKESP